jgi:hypothetical protein
MSAFENNNVRKHKSNSGRGLIVSYKTQNGQVFVDLCDPRNSTTFTPE